MNRDIERYLNRATKGLAGKKRSEVKEELRAHIQEKLLGYQVAGLNQSDAISKTLSDLGQARTLNHAMLLTYRKTPFLALSIGFILLSFGLFTLINRSHTQSLAVTNIFPSSLCLENTPRSNLLECHPGLDLWVHSDDLKRVLESQGVTFNMKSQTKDWEIPFPDQKKTLKDWRTLNIAEASTSEGYLSFWSIIKDLSFDHTVTITDFYPLSFDIDGIRLELDLPESGLDFIKPIVGESVNAMFSSASKQSDLSHARQIVDVAEDGMYASVSGLNFHPALLDIAASQNRTVSILFSGHKSETLLKLENAIKAGRLDYQILSPEQYSLHQ